MKILIYFLVSMPFFLSFLGCDNNHASKNNSSYSEYIKTAEKFMDENKNHEAIEAYKNAIRIKDDDPKIHFALGKLYDFESQKTYKEAFTKYQFEVLTNVNKRMDKDINKDLERLGFKSQYKNMAIQEYKLTLKKDPSHWEARYFIATDHLNNKRYKEAIDEYQSIIKTKPDNVSAHRLLGESYFEIGKCNAALDEFQIAFQLNNDMEKYLFDTGKVYIKMADHKKITETINKLKGSMYYNDLTGYQFKVSGKCN